MTDNSSKQRQAHERRGHKAEFIAAAALITSGHRIIARRAKTHLGEIDLIARRGQHLAFIEVKRRETFADCEAAITLRLRQRVRNAAGLWLAKRPGLQSFDQSFDVIFVVPWRWPRHIRGGL